MGERLIASFNELATKTVGINQVYPASAYNTPGLLFALRRDSMAGAKALIKDGFCIGTPDDVIASLRRWESIGCDGIMFLVNSKQVIPQEQVLNSLRLFAKEVMPKFKDPEPVDVRRPEILTPDPIATSNGKSARVVADA
jgi:alkanesulfonate monooxygenase SsuD/methylene tetrahydromethanopterin reductase-like flavin-dependent oxidoreductase (luciferase family)